MYADKDQPNALEFNSLQRGMQNCFENYPQFVATMFIASLYRPIPAAICGCVRLIGFWFYFDGYARNGPKGRFNSGSRIGLLSVVGIACLGFEVVVRLIVS